MRKAQLKAKNLWNPDRRGTLIISDPRCGTHFLQRAVISQVTPHRPIDRNGEIDIPKKTPQLQVGEYYENLPIGPQLAALEKKSAYQVGIVNSISAKLELLADPALLAPWHVIRLTRHDKVGWMRSWVLFFLHPKSALYSTLGDSLMHHGTGIEHYTETLRKSGAFELTPQVIKDIVGSLTLHTISPLIEVDEELDYDQLPHLQTEDNPWKGNDYPDLPMDVLFSSYDRIQPLLEHWHHNRTTGRLRGR